jgi:hypothetical protein
MVDPSGISPEDIARLDELGFFPSGEGYFRSTKFGSA